MAKKEINLEQFRAIIKEEAMKLNKRTLLENEKNSLQSELKSLLGESYLEECGYEEQELEMNTGDTMDEAAMEELFGGAKRKKENMRNEFLKYAKVWKAKGAIRGMNQEMLDGLMAQAEADNFEGKPGLDKETQLMNYRAANDINWAGLGLASSGSFGGTGE
jgi:hypothetical protein